MVSEQEETRSIEQPWLAPNIRCPIDNSDESTPWAEFRIGTDIFHVHQCVVCSLRFLQPQPNPKTLQAYYSQRYYGQGNAKFVPIIQLLRRISIEKKVRKIQAIYQRDTGTVIDIGCADGTFLFNIKKRQWNTIGMEISDSLQASAILKDLQVYTGDIRDQVFPNRYFDVVTLWHVFEHLPDPDGYLREITRILKPEGLLILTLPNIESWQARIFQKKWFHLDIPRHLFHYAPRTLAELLSRHSFSIEKTEHFSLEYNPFGYIQSFYNVVFRDDNRFYESLKHTNWRVVANRAPFLIVEFLLLPLLIPPAVLLSTLEAMRKRGGTMKVYVRKKSPTHAR